MIYIYLNEQEHCCCMSGLGLEVFSGLIGAVADQLLLITPKEMRFETDARTGFMTLRAAQLPLIVKYADRDGRFALAGLAPGLSCGDITPPEVAEVYYAALSWQFPVSMRKKFPVFYLSNDYDCAVNLFVKDMNLIYDRLPELLGGECSDALLQRIKQEAQYGALIENGEVKREPPNEFFSIG